MLIFKKCQKLANYGIIGKVSLWGVEHYNPFLIALVFGELFQFLAMSP